MRIPDESWEPAKAIAAEHGETMTDVINRAVQFYASTHGHGVDPVTALERLARLHRSGSLTDAEFAAAKAVLLGRL